MPKQWKEINKKKKVTEITKHSYSLKNIGKGIWKDWKNTWNT